MIVDDQARAIAFIVDFAGRCGTVETMHTHISHIFLAADRVYKMKRAVRLPYADFSTPQLRLSACLKEVELNSATAPGLYLGVRRITEEENSMLTLDGKGTLVDAVVEMKRFTQDALFDALAVAEQLTPRLAGEMAETIHAFHQTAPILHTGGGAANIAGVLDINEASFATSHLFAPAEMTDLNRAFRKALATHEKQLDLREASGKVRRCHGDLHLRNICLLDAKPCLFDCIEFNDSIATIDTLYDLAFLLMDLWRRDLKDIANLVANRYIDLANDEGGFALLPFFMALRAAVRAHVTATQAESGDPGGDLAAEARSCFELARQLLTKAPPRLVAIGGLSGTGKTTIAEMLACHVGMAPGARIVESDRIRKAMQNVSVETRLPESAYRPEISERVYEEMARRAAAMLQQGASVVANAVFDQPGKRELIENAARRTGARFTGLWLLAAPNVLRQRVGARKGGPSDATLEILSRQLQRDAGSIAWRKTDAGGAPQAIVSAIILELERAEVHDQLSASVDNDNPCSSG